MSAGLASVTRLRLRRPWTLLPFFLAVRRINREAARAPGFRTGAVLADRGRVFWTLTLWDDAASMRAFLKQGAHRRVAPKLFDWCDEARTVHFAASALPDWGEAHARLVADGFAYRLRHPNAAHLDGLVAAPADPKRRALAIISG